MKLTSLFIPLTTALIVTGCAADDVMTDIPSDRIDMQPISQSRTRSIAEAAQIAVEALPMIDGNSARSSRTFDMSNAKIYTTPLSRSDAGVDTLMYVFNFDNEAGFAAVAADRAAEGLIAITEKGSYDPAETPDNPGLAIYMAAAKEYLLDITDRKKDTIIKIGGDPVPAIPDPDPRKQYKVFHDTVSKYNMPPTLGVTIKWGQNFPTGMLFDNGTCGCTVLAPVMAMTYYKYPTTLTLTYEGRDSESVQIDWNEVIKHRQAYDCSSSGCTETGHIMLAKLCRELGNRAGSKRMDSETGGFQTGTNPEKMRNALSEFGYHLTDNLIYSQAQLESLLTNYKIVIMGGHPENSNTGHTWVVDGYKSWTIHSKECYSYDGKRWFVMNDMGSTTYTYNHINWGWNGEGNGYYREKCFDATKPFELDPGAAPYNHTYSCRLHIYSIYR